MANFIAILGDFMKLRAINRAAGHGDRQPVRLRKPLPNSALRVEAGTVRTTGNSLADFGGGSRGIGERVAIQEWLGGGGAMVTV